MRRIMIVLLIAALLGTTSLRPADAAGIRYAPPTVTLTLGSQTYTPGADLDWRYTLYNGNDQPLGLTFPTSQVYDLVLWHGATVVARWSTGKAFADIVTARSVGMGETMELTGSWKLPSNLVSGDYRLQFSLASTTTEPTDAGTDFTVAKPGVSGLRAGLTTGKLIYRVGTQLTVSCTVRNTGTKDVQLTFPTAQQYNWTVVEYQGKTIYNWQADRSFAQVLTTLTIPAGGSHTFESSWQIPSDLKPSGFYVYFTIPADQMGTLRTQRAAVLIGSTPR